MRRALSLLLCGLLVVCSGCADERQAPEHSWEEYQQSQQQPQLQPAEPSPEYPESFALPYHKDHTLDPITCGEGIQENVAALLYEPLVRLDNAFEPQPLLCTGWERDTSGLVWTLQLRSGVLFSDGTELTAADAAASLQRAAASEKYGYRLRRVVSAVPTRDGQVVVTLSQPCSGFASLLDIPVVKKGTETQSVPVGTGPYVFVNSADGSVLQANGDWWQQQPLPVSAVELVHAKDAATAAYLFSSRRISLLCVDPTADGLSPTGQVQETELPTGKMQFIGFNTRSGVFSDPAARQLFHRGLQRDMLADAFLSGHGETAFFPISPRSSLYPRDLEAHYSYDETQTRLEELGFTGGEAVPLTLLVNQENPFRLAAANYIADSMSLGDWQIGVKALPWEEYLAALEAGAFDLYYGEVRLTADWDLQDLIGSEGSLNYGGYSSGSTDSLLQTFASSSTRENVGRLLCTQLLEEAPIAPICFRSSVVLTHPGTVENITTAPDDLFGSFSRWTIHLSTPD